MEFLLSHLPNLQQLGIEGYWFLFLISFAEAFIFTGWVVPGTVIVVIIGGLSAHGYYDFGDAVFFAILGAILGDSLSYELGRRGQNLIGKWTFLERRIERSRPFFSEHQGKSIVFGRFIGWIRPIVPFVAGVMRMPRVCFYTANILSAIAWAVAYLGIGYLFGAAWKVALLGFSKIALVLLIPLVLFLFLAFLWRSVLHEWETVVRVALSIFRSMGKGLRENEYIGPWIARHTRLISFLRARISVEAFQGLPLTLLLLATVYSFSVFSGILEDYLTSDPLIAIDIRLANLFYAFRYEPLLQIFYEVTVLANSVTVIVAALLLTIILWQQRRRVYILVLWLTLLGSEGTVTLGKLFFHRPRPSGLLPVLPESSASFPSGHAASAVVLFGFLAYLLIREHCSWKVKISSFFGAIAAILLIDFSRLYLGVHYLSDVLAGNMLALSILLFAISVGEWIQSLRTATILPFSWKPMLMLPVLGVFSVAFFTMFAPLSPKPPIQTASMQTLSTVTIPDLFHRGVLPATTETLIGTPQEPLNLLLIVPDECLVASLAKAGWIEADNPSVETTFKLAKAALLNATYPAAPMTPSFYDTQPHTTGFEKETEKQSVHSRHHARFWALPYRTMEGALWVGTASLDTGIKWGIAHRIAPDIDTERNLLASDLKGAGVIASEEEFALVSPTLGKNFSGDEFFTDGKTILFRLKECN